ncbi:charged multivesicular body protein 7 isoform X2 [Macrosteles quadrilineatus]|uniref:charged multivesicular body protein 7 isoform X2 n=1 Tax=Macrosteles quadrilineatus TaxID=74068 RepID=UPI0023E28A16|nr:charged multivesicular body protein 7 isoform X2 [Macrosteles quadrilineatus]
MCDDAKQEARLNVLYSPFRKKEVNPQDWESKMSYWKCNITNWCIASQICVFSQSKLQTVFVRNGRPASCLTTVLENMIRNNEVIRLEELLSKDQPTLQSWSTWAVNCFIKAPVVWSFSKMKESLISKPDDRCDEEYVHLTVLKVNNKTLIKLARDSERVSLINETDIGMFRLQHNERTLKQMLEQLETERQAADLEARNYLKKGMRQSAKTCLRKRKELEKCIEKRASALENVQVLLTRVKEAESDGKILESYKMGLEALKATFKSAGLSEDSVGDTMDQVREVLEVHEEVQNALSGPVASSLDEDLEKELAELLLEDKKVLPSPSLPDLPEPPTHSPDSSSIRVYSKSIKQFSQ